MLSLADLVALFDNLADGVYVVDADQHVLYWNDAAERITGTGREVALGRLCFEVMAGTDFAGQRSCSEDCVPIRCALRLEAVPNYDELVRPGGRRMWMNVSHLPVRAAEFDQPLLVHIFRRITAPQVTNALAEQTVTAVSHYADAPRDADAGEAATDHLTSRELEVLRLLAAGASVRSIAIALTITPATVRNHIEHLMNKLDAHTRVQAVVIGAGRGLL